MTEPVYFLVTRRHGEEKFSLCYERIPTAYSGHRARDNGLVYVLRLDTLPEGERWMARPLSELAAQYAWLKVRGRLPASNIGKGATATRD
jgi:hypothetical protein